jgi:hypothetical protein
MMPHAGKFEPTRSFLGCSCPNNPLLQITPAPSAILSRRFSPINLLTGIIKRARRVDGYLWSGPARPSKQPVLPGPAQYPPSCV